MICFQCKEEGRQSTVYPGLSTTTLLGFQPYYDELGRFHSHDPNKTTTRYRCSNGHAWEEVTQKRCWCEEAAE